MNNRNFKWHPDAEHRFFLHDPEGNGFVFFKTEAERDTAAQDAIADYLEDGWSLEVENLIVGVVTGTAQKCDVTLRAEVSIDEDGNDEEGRYWDPDWAWMCNYKIKEL